MRCWDRPNEAMILSMGIRPGWRGRGLGQRFVQQVLGRLRGRALEREADLLGVERRVEGQRGLVVLDGVLEVEDALTRLRQLELRLRIVRDDPALVLLVDVLARIHVERRDPQPLAHARDAGLGNRDDVPALLEDEVRALAREDHADALLALLEDQPLRIDHQLFRGDVDVAEALPELGLELGVEQVPREHDTAAVRQHLERDLVRIVLGNRAPMNRSAAQPQHHRVGLR